MDIEVALLTMKDDAYTAEINKYRAALVGYTFKSESTTNGETTNTIRKNCSWRERMLPKRWKSRWL